MDSVEQLDDLEAEAKKRAIKYVSNLLQTPDKLDNIQQIKINVARKKASVETALKTAVQKQLEGNHFIFWKYWHLLFIKLVHSIELLTTWIH